MESFPSFENASKVDIKSKKFVRNATKVRVIMIWRMFYISIRPLLLISNSLFDVVVFSLRN